MSYAPEDVSFTGAGSGGTVAVRDADAVCPAPSVTRYVIGVRVPLATDGSAANVATPVVLLMVHVPSPATVTDALQMLSLGSTRQGPSLLPVCNDVPDASADVPMTFVNVAVPPGVTDLLSGLATGVGGGAIVGVMVADVTAPKESDT